MSSKKMFTTLVLTVVLTVWSVSAIGVEPIGTAFTYQGRLIDSNSSADGLYDFRFSLFDANEGGRQAGGYIYLLDVDVVDGYFTVELDFGTNIFTGYARWLEIGVRLGELEDPNEYTTLIPRQELTPTPYSIHADEAAYAWTAFTDNDWVLAADNMYSVPTGNIGIGTNNPGAKLDVEVSSGPAATIGSSTNSATGDYAIAMGYDTDAVGNSSTAMGYQTTASGNSSTAMGVLTDANGPYSTAIGYATDANGDNSTAMGLATTASGYCSTSMGRLTVASGAYSTAMGYYSVAGGAYSTAMGRNAETVGYDSTAIGYYTTAGGDYSVAMGQETTAGGGRSTAMGYATTASGSTSTSMGHTTTASGDYSTAMGNTTDASGSASTAMGHQTTASGGYSTSMGHNTTASGLYSTAMGHSTTADGYVSTAMGYYTTASEPYSTAMGLYTTASGPYSTAMGQGIEAGGDYSVAIALSDQSGTVVTQDNAMSIMGGNVGIGTTGPTSKLHVDGGCITGSMCSDIRLKKNIEPLPSDDSILDRVMGLQAVTFEWKHRDDGKRQIGLIAQDVEVLFPEVVTTPDDESCEKGLLATGLDAVLVEAMKELRSENDELQEQNNRLESRLSALEDAMRSGLSIGKEL